jgi:hypothetical protein
VSENLRQVQKAADHERRVNAAWSRGARHSAIAHTSTTTTKPTTAVNAVVIRKKEMSTQFHQSRTPKVPNGLPAPSNNLSIFPATPRRQGHQGAGHNQGHGYGKHQSGNRHGCEPNCPSRITTSMSKGLNPLCPCCELLRPYNPRAAAAPNPSFIAGPRYEEIPKVRSPEEFFKVLKVRQPIPTEFRLKL